METAGRGQPEGGRLPCTARGGERKGAGGRQSTFLKGPEGLPGGPTGKARGQKLQAQLNTHLSPTLYPKQNRGPPETVSALTFHMCKQQLENPSAAWEDAG